jgi:capsular polysaccharide biosynthesis protein/Flp pilus assembly protein TadD
LNSLNVQTEEPPLLSLAPFRDYAHFVEVLPSCTRVPASPRFIFGNMPAEVATAYYARQGLPPTGLYTARALTISDGPLLWAEDQLLVAPELNLHRSQIETIFTRYGYSPESEPPSYLKGPHALIVGHGYQIYGHWLAEILPKLAVLQAAGYDLDRLKLLVPDDAPPFALETFRLLGLQSEQLVRFGGRYGRVTVEELLAPSFLHNAVRYSAILHSAAFLMRQRVEIRHGNLAQGNYPQRIMLTRKGGSRPLIGRAEVEATCLDAKFTLVAPESLSLLEQWRMFADAREIIGEYGSAFHGSMFSAPGTVVCALRGSQFHPAFIQSGFGERLLQPTGYVFGITEDQNNGSFRIRHEDLRACINHIFSGTHVREGELVLTPHPNAKATPADYISYHDRLVQEGHTDAALMAIRQAIKIAPDHPEAHAKRAYLLAPVNVPGALDAITKAIAGGETSAQNLALKVDLLLRAGRRRAAVEAAEVALRHAPEDSLALDWFATALLHNGRAQEAVDVARRAVALKPSEPRYQLTLFNALFEAGNFDEAESVIRAAHKDSPRALGIASGLIRVLSKKRHLDEALHVALCALAEAPDHPELRALLSGLIRPAESGGSDALQKDDSIHQLPVVRGTFNINFTAAGNSAIHCVEGWAAQEPPRLWASGERSTLMLPPIDASRDWIAAIDLGVFILPPTVTGQRLCIEVNGTKLLERVLTKATILQMMVPKEVIKPRQIMIMHLIHPDCVTPKALGVGNDTRSLSICLHNIRFSPGNSQS